MFSDKSRVLRAVQDFFQSRHVVVIGDVMLDRYLKGSVLRISPEAPVPVVRIENQCESLGGAGNVALNLRELGLSVSLSGYVGDDSAGESVRNSLKMLSIDSNGLLSIPKRHTTSKTRIIGGHQQIARCDVEVCAPAPEEEQQRLLEWFKLALKNQPSAILLSDYAKGVLTPHVCKTVISSARLFGIPVLVDPKGTDYEKYTGATFISPNRQELAAVTGATPDDTEALCAAGHALVSKLNLESLVLTLSEQGIALLANGKTQRFPARAREVFDVSGAGDTVISILAASLANKLGIEDAIVLANIAAGIVVGKIGTVPIKRADLVEAISTENTSLGSKKIRTLISLQSIVNEWRAGGLTVVFTNGCFDLLHAGHVSYLESARRLGHRLIVGLNSDASVSRLKGMGRPVIPQIQRASVLAALSAVDAVIVFDEDTPLNLINLTRPNILVKGSDYNEEQVVGAGEVRSWGGRVVLVPVVPGLSTSEILLKVEKGEIQRS